MRYCFRFGCNSLINVLIVFNRYSAGQLKIMFVGGPNTRKDYHIEEGEEVQKTNLD